MNSVSLKRPFISIQEIEQYLALNRQVANAKKELDRLTEVLFNMEISLINKVEIGSVVPVGYEAKVKSFARRFPAWRDEFIQVAGKDAAENVLEATPAKIYKSLLIMVGQS